MKDYFKNIFKGNSYEYYSLLKKYLQNDEKKFVITANPETLWNAKNDAEFSKIITNKNNDVLADGIAVVKAAKHYRIMIKGRTTGFDTALELLKYANELNKSLYLFGAKPDVLAATIDVIKRDYPNIKLVGSTDGYVNDKDKIMESVVKLNPDICLVALGIPAQEKLIARHIEKASTGIYMGVGGTFDVLSGSKKRAPKLMIKLNLEWLYRLFCEPQRLKRFYKNNIKFMYYVYKDKR